ncbi:MAG: gamma-glutamylcyclotransferase family protein [Pseudomonadota bacterium]
MAALPVFNKRTLRRFTGRSWLLAKMVYPWFGLTVTGQPEDRVWYFAFGSNMHDDAFRKRRGMRPQAWHAARLGGYRLRFNLRGWPPGKAAPANIEADPDEEVWGVLYAISRRELLFLDSTEGVPGGNYRHLWARVTTAEGQQFEAVTYIARGLPDDGNPSLRYLTLLREGARAHDLPRAWIERLEAVQHAR